MTKQSLEAQITAALSDDTITSADLGKLIEQAEAAVSSAKQQLKDKRAAALQLDADPQSVARAITTAEIVLTRLDAVLPKLDQRFQTTLGREKYAA